MKIFYDCEFLDDGRAIYLISIGMVAEDGREFYAINRMAPWDLICRTPWLVANVLPSLPGKIDLERATVGVVYDRGYRIPPGSRDVPTTWWVPDPTDPSYLRRDQIADGVRAFILDGSPDPELWAWYAAYDHVALAQLWGPMVNLPEGIPMFTCDLKQEAVRRGNPRLPDQLSGEHNALADARHNLVRARVLGIVA